MILPNPGVTPSEEADANRKPTEAELLQHCADEPIRRPGTIQPHGCVLAVDRSTGVVDLVSTNTADLLGVPPNALLGEPLPTWLPLSLFSQAVAQQANPVRFVPPVRLTHPGGGNTELNGIAHPLDGPDGADADQQHHHLLLSLEPANPTEPVAPIPPATPPVLQGHVATDPLFELTREAVAAAQRYATVGGFADGVAELLRRFTGYDRVMVYRFHRNHDGSVIGESHHPDLSPYRGLRYPASDIPPQARALYLRQLLRQVVDVDAEPVPLIGRPDGLLDATVDLAESGLRSVSPVHLQYLRNMGVGATLTMSLVHEGELWGLLACHHRTPRFLSYERRSACELLASVIGTQFKVKADAEQEAAAARRRVMLLPMVHGIDTGDDLLAGLARTLPAMLDLVGADLGFVAHGPNIDAAEWRATPEQVKKLTAGLAWDAQQRVGQTDRLPEPVTLEGFTDAAWARLKPADTDDTPPESTPPDQRRLSVAGTLVVRLKPNLDLVFLRREARLQQRWGGEPSKVNIRGTGRAARLQPRSSFAEFLESIRGRSRPWSSTDRELAAELHGMLASFVVRRLDRVAEELGRRVQAEAELAKAKLTTRLAGRLGGIATWEFDTATGRFTDTDWYAQLGHSLADVPHDLGGFRRLVHPDDADAALAQFEPPETDPTAEAESEPGDAVTRSAQFRLWHADGRWVWVESLGQHLVSAAGLPPRIVGLHYDIDRLRSTQAGLMTKNDELQSLVYAISHDLKAPLVTVKGFIGMLRADFADGDLSNADRDLQRVEEATTNMTAVIDDLLALSRLGRDGLRVGPIDLDHLIGRMQDDFALELQNTGTTLTQMQPLEPLQADLPAVQRVLYNLIDNAIRYACFEPGRQIRVGCLPMENEAGSVLVVEDEGPGIEPIYKERVFAIFERLARDQLGSGVGLASVAKAAELHGGRAWVQDRPDGEPGASFRVFFPLHRPDPESAAAGPADGPAAE